MLRTITVDMDTLGDVRVTCAGVCIAEFDYMIQQVAKGRCQPAWGPSGHPTIAVCEDSMMIPLEVTRDARQVIVSHATYRVFLEQAGMAFEESRDLDNGCHNHALAYCVAYNLIT